MLHEEYRLFQPLPQNLKDTSVTFGAFNARHIITSQRSVLFPETVVALSVVLEGYKYVSGEEREVGLSLPPGRITATGTPVLYLAVRIDTFRYLHNNRTTRVCCRENLNSPIGMLTL